MNTTTSMHQLHFSPKQREFDTVSKETIGHLRVDCGSTYTDQFVDLHNTTVARLAAPLLEEDEGGGGNQSVIDEP